MKAKLFSLFLVLIASIGVTNAEIFNGTCGLQGDNVTWSYDSEDSVLTISGNGQMTDWESFDVPWTEYRRGINTLVIDEGITRIGNYAFAGSFIKDPVIIPNSVISIGEWAFYQCSYLSSVTFGQNLTTIGDRAFVMCYELASVTIPQSVTSIGVAVFSNCRSLKYISVEEGNVYYDSRENCHAIIETATNTIIAGCNRTKIPQSVTKIGYWSFAEAYASKAEVTDLVLPNSITFIDDGAFYQCHKITTITCEAVTPPTLGGEQVFYTVDTSISLYVPAESIDAYKSADGWKNFTNIRAISGNSGNTPLFPGDPGTLTLDLELKAAVVDGVELSDYAPTGAGGYPQGTSVTITAQDIPGYAFVRWSDEVTDKSRTIVLNESMTLTALYDHSLIEISIAANKWNFISLPPLGDRQYTADMFTYDGLSDVQWGTYNGSKRAAGQSGWETPETFNALQGYILYSTTAGTLRINAYQDEIRQGESGNTIYEGMTAYASSHPENESWNFLGNPYSQGYNIAGLAAAGIESPITVWNGVGYTTYTPGIDSYILNPFEAFFIQKAESGIEGITFSSEYLESNDGNYTAIEGELSGAFSIAEGRQVHFSRGNLQYQASTNTWRFAENQYDTIGAFNANISSTYDGWIDLFGWGTGNNPTNSSEDYDNDYSTFVDWGVNAISNGGNEANLWRTLTDDEWMYLFYTRTDASSKYGQATVAGVNGVIVLPDVYEGSAINTAHSAWSNNTISAEAWALYETAGAVFLPAAGLRGGTDVRNVGSNGYYWSSTPCGTSNAYLVDFHSVDLGRQGFSRGGESVRLVR